MCGRFCQTQTGGAIASTFELEHTPDLAPRYNIAPTQPVSVITQTRHQGRVCHPKRWGLIPKWAKDGTLGQRLINARVETVAEKPSFRDAFQKRRCLVIADGFYEWQRSRQKANARQQTEPAAPTHKQPFLIQLQSREVFAFAGLWERWQDPETRQDVFSCTILTTQSNTLMANIHHRMPVILDAEAYDAWLDPSFYNPGYLEQLLCPHEGNAMEAIPISNAVNNPRCDSPTVQQPSPGND